MSVVGWWQGLTKETRFLTPGTRNRVSLDNLCLPTCPYMETRFLTSPGFSPLLGTRNRVSLRNLCLPTGPYMETRFLTSPGFSPLLGQKEETGFL
jgi:hypothetical protein